MRINSRFGNYLEDNQHNTFNGRFSAVGETLQPNLGEKCYFLFEIPKSSQGIKLYLKAYLEKHAVDLKI
jgi:hypothetical protein